MRRILLVLTVALVMVAMLAISVGSAWAYPYGNPLWLSHPLAGEAQNPATKHVPASEQGRTSFEKVCDNNAVSSNADPANC